MDDESILFGIRNAFALGNYQIVINQVSSARAFQSASAQLESQCLLYRAYLAQAKYNLVINDIDEASLEAPLKAIRLAAVYFKAKQGGQPTESAIQDALALLDEGANRVEPTIQVIVATILVNDGKHEEALKVLHSRTKKLEW